MNNFHSIYLRKLVESFESGYTPTIDDLRALGELADYLDREDGVLTLRDSDSGSDYDLAETAGSVWIGVQNLSIYIVQGAEGVSIDVYPQGDEMTDSLGGTWVLYTEADDQEKDPYEDIIPALQEYVDQESWDHFDNVARTRPVQELHDLLKSIGFLSDWAGRKLVVDSVYEDWVQEVDSE